MSLLRNDNRVRGGSGWHHALVPPSLNLTPPPLATSTMERQKKTGWREGERGINRRPIMTKMEVEVGRWDRGVLAGPRIRAVPVRSSSTLSSSSSPSPSLSTTDGRMATTMGSWQASVPTPCVRTQIVPRHAEAVSLLPLTWDILVSIYRELVRLINKLPFHQKLVVCIVFRGNKIRLDLGEVRAAGVVCLIGLGLSLGTLLLYRLYFRIVVPFLQRVWADKGKEGVLDDEYTLYLESSSDSEVDETMGNSHSKKSTPSVYYAPGYGVALGSRPPSLTLDEENIVDLSRETTDHNGVRLRQTRRTTRHKSPSPASDKDSAIGGIVGSEMSQSLYSENSINRDSFYSTCTAESGFDEYWNCHHSEESRTGLKSGSFGAGSSSLHPNQTRERNIHMLYRAHHGHDPGLNSLRRSAKPGLDTLSDVSSERSGIVSARSQLGSSSDSVSSVSNYPQKTNVDPLLEKFASERASLNGARPGSRQTMVSSGHSGVEEVGDVGQQHFSLSETTSPIGNRRAGNVHTKPTDRTDIANVADLMPEMTSSPAILSTQSSPYRNIRHRAGANQGVRGGYSQTPLRRPPGDFPYDYDAELDGSESIRSFNSSADGDIDWDEDHSHRDDFMSVLPSDHYQPSVSDLQFRQSLMQRIHEWSAFAEEYNKSRSPTPDCPPVRFVRRSRSLDRNLEEPSLLVLEPDLTPGVSQPLEMEPTTERNLETLEYELHDIQGEFESITSKLHELIEQGNSDTDTAPTTTPAPHTHRTPKSSDANSCHDNKPRSGHHRLAPSTPRSIDHCIRTRWERVPSSACSDSSRSSRASSVEYVWDHADYHNSSNAGGTGELTDTEIALSAGPEVVNMCQPMIISDYVEREWKGDTEKARTIRQAYAQIPRLFSCHRLSVVRGDNYCGLRSTLFQVLSLGQRVTKGWSGIISLTDSLHDLYNESSSGLQHWTFGNRLPGHCKDRLASLSKCALSLYATIEEVCNLPSWEEREQRTMGLLNSGATFDLELLEGLKVMMALKMAELERAIRDGDDSVPVFAHLLMARDSSETMEQFVKNHLNPVGDTGGLEQVEMCLLGYTLGIRIRVLRLSQFGQQDFDCIFPEDVPEEWPEIPLIAEDDRHYNVPLP